MRTLLKNPKLRPTVFILFCLFLFGATFAQKTWDGGGDGVNWNSVNNWNPNGLPTSADAVILSNNASITVNTTNAVCASLQLGGTANNTRGILTFSATGSPKLTVTGAITMGGNSNKANRAGTITFVSGATLECGSLTLGNGNNSPSVLTMSAASSLITGALNVGGTGTTWTPSTGSVTIKATDTLPTNVFTSFNNLTISSGTTTAGVGFSIGGLLTIASGSTLNMNTFVMTGASLTTSGTGTLITQNTSASPLPTGRTWSGTIQYNTTTGGQTVMSGTYNNLNLNNTSGSQSTSGNITINGSLTTTAGGTLNIGTNQLLGTLTNISNAATIRTQNTSATPIPSGKTWGGTVQFDGAGQSIPGSGTTFNNLIFGGSGTKTLTSAAMTISGDFIINTSVIANLGIFTSTANKLFLGGTGQPSGQHGGTTSGATFINSTFFATATGKLNVVSCTAAGTWSGATSTNWATASNWCDGIVPTAFSNVFINSGGNQPVISSAAICNNITLGSGSTLTLNSTLDVAGNWTNNGSTVSGSGTVTLSGSCSLGGLSSTTFPNLTTTGTITQRINTSVSGDFNQTTGIYNQNAGATAYSMTVTGNFTLSGSSIYNMQSTNTGTGATTTVNGTTGTTISGTATLNMDSGGAAVANVSIFQTTNFTSTSTANDTTGIIDFGNQVAVKNNQFRISGNCTKTGTTGRFFTTSNAVNGGFVFNGSGTTQTVNITAFVDAGTRSEFYNFTVNTGAVVQLTNGLTLGFNNIPSCTVTVNGTLDTQALSPGVLGGATNGAFILASGGTLRTANTNGIVSNTIGAISNSIGTRTFNNAANYIFNGTANQNTSFPNSTMNNLTVANIGITPSNIVTINTAAPTVNGSLTVLNGVLDATAFQIVGNTTNPFTLASGTTFRLSGAYPTLFTSGNTTFNSTSTAEYYGATQTVSSIPTYGNLIISTTGAKTAGGALTLVGGLTINTGATFVASSFTHNVAGNWTNNGIFTANTSTINLNGNAQSISGLATTFNNLTLATSTSTKTFGIGTTINSNFIINNGVKANLGTYKSTSATLTTGGIAQTTGTSYGGTGSPASNINSTFFTNNTGYLNVGACSTYSLTSTAAPSAACVGSTATINVISTVANLPNGNYIVFYTLGAPNARTGTATMTVSGGTGSGSFVTTTLANNGVSSVTINIIRNGCVSAISSGNTATITVNALPTTATNASTQTICATGTATLAGNTPSIGTGAWSVVSGPSVLTSQFNSLNNPTAVFTPAGGAGSYVVRWTISNSPCTASTANATITVNGLPTTATNTSTQTICATGTATLAGNVPSIGTGAWSVVSGPSVLTSQFSSLNNPTAVFTPAGGTGSYVVRWTISNSPCVASTANATITVIAAPTTATNSSTQTMCSSTPAIVLSGNSPSVGIGAWSVVSGPSTLASQFSSNSSLAIFTPAGGVGAYVTRWSISNGSCTTSTADATVTVVSETVAGTITGGSTICSGSTSGLLTLSGHTGTVIRWESSTSPFTTWIPIANTATTYTSGNLTQETRFRAVVQNSSCTTLNSASTSVTMGNTSTWNGSSWSNGVPVPSTAAIIAGNYVSSINGGDINACTLTINSGNVIISSENTVSLFGALNVISGSFTIENNANLIQSTNVTNSGNIILKRYAPPLMRQDYILWSSPVANQQLMAFSPLTLVNRFYTYDAATDKYAPVASPSTTNFAPGIGYLIRVPNTHPTTPTIFGGQFIGVANNGTVNLPVTNATFNAVGNPYPSTINANAFIAQNGISEALYFWRKTNNTNNSSYATYTTAGGVCNSGGDPLFLTPNGIIAVGQGFIVKSTSTNITFNNTMRVSNTNAPFLRTFDERNRIWLNLSSASGAFYQTMVSYMPKATSNVDAAIDGRFLNDTPNALTSLIEGQEYTIQGRALPFDGSDTVLLGFKGKTAENYTITLSNFDGLFSSNQSVFIKDKLANIIHDLKSGPYTFASEAGTFNARFEIVYQNSSLSNQTPSFNEKSIVVYKQNQEVVINSGKVQMSNVSIFDIRGRLLVSKDNINASEIKLHTGITKQVLIVKIISDTNGIVTKKIIN